MTFDLWPADSEFELDLYFSVIYLHIQNIQNPSNIFEVIVRKPIWIYNELWPLTCGLRIRTWPVFLCHLPTHPKYSKSVQHFWSYCAETNLNIWAVTFDLWPADSEFELDLYFCVIYLHIQNIQNPSNIFEVIVRKPSWIYELWALTFDLRTPNSNLTCIFVSSTYTLKIFKIRPTFLKLLCGNQFEYIISCDLWPLTCGLQIRTWPLFLCHLPTHQKYSKSVQHFWSYCVETYLNI